LVSAIRTWRKLCGGTLEDLPNWSIGLDATTELKMLNSLSSRG
jgi:hypothetical protein